ncbi:MAG: DUF1150 family protein [Siculibacillus sp.]
MSDRSIHPFIDTETLARLGEGEVAYIREFRSEEIAAIYPGGPDLPAGVRLWALIGAAGRPILVADDPSLALAGALDQDLTTVWLN